MFRKQYFWIVVGMAFIATALSFLDRQVLSILIIKIKEEITVSDIQYGFINTGFLVGYAIMFSVSGILIDRYGSRFGLGISVGIWSVATALHSVANNVFQFGTFRFLLGVGEGGAFPGAVKAVSDWVPKKSQALANGIAIGGAALGAVIAPPMCVFLLVKTGWRGIFLATSVIGFIWVIGWFIVTRKKKQRQINSGVEAIERFELNRMQRPSIGLMKLFAIREVWVIIAMRFFLDPILYFYMFWIPKYLNETRSLDIDQIGKLFWIPFLALGVSNILGGWVSDFLFSKTSNLNFARKAVMFSAAILMLPVVLVKFAPTPEIVILILSVAFFAHGLWITNYITSINDLFGNRLTSTVVGFSGTAGAISAFVINPVIGIIISRVSYNPMWIYAGLMYLVVYLGFTYFIPKIRLVDVCK